MSLVRDETLISHGTFVSTVEIIHLQYSLSYALGVILMVHYSGVSARHSKVSQIVFALTPGVWSMK